MFIATGKPILVLIAALAASPAARAGNVEPTSPNRVLRVDSMPYHLVDAAHPMEFSLPSGGNLTLVVRANLPSGPAGDDYDRCVLELARLGDGGARVVHTFEVEDLVDTGQAYDGPAVFHPSEELVLGARVQDGGKFRLSLVDGAPLGVVVALELQPTGRLASTGGAPKTFEELAGAPLPDVPSMEDEDEPALGGRTLSLSLGWGAVAQLAGDPGPSMVGALGIWFSWRSMALGLEIQRLDASHEGDVPVGWGPPSPVSLAYEGTPIQLLVRLDATSWPLAPFVLLGSGVTPATETLAALYGDVDRAETLLLLPVTVAVGVGMDAGPGAVEVSCRLTTHPAVLEGDPMADAPLGTMLMTTAGYRWDLL